MSTDQDTGTRPNVSGDEAPASAGVTAPDGGGNGQPEAPQPPTPPQEDTATEVVRLRAENAAYQRFLDSMRVAEPDAGAHPPMPDAGRTQRDDETQALEIEIAALANSKDPVARMLLREKQARLEERQLYGQAIAALNEKIEMNGMPTQERSEFNSFLKANRHRFADFEGAKLAWKGMRAEAAGGAPTPAARPAVTAPRPKLVQDVDAHARPLPAREAAERVMTEEQYDDLVLKLHNDGDHEGARSLARKLSDGEIVLKKQ